MSEVGDRPTARKPARETISADSVIRFLTEHPDFIASQPDLLARLDVPHGQNGGAASLLEYQVDVLKEKNRDLARRLKELVAIAGENQQLMERVHGLVLALMACDSREELMDRLSQRIRDDFNADMVSVCLFDDAQQADSVMGLKSVPRDDPSLTAFAEFLNDLEPLCGRLKQDKMTFLYATEADTIRSSVLLPLDAEGRIGMLAIGSNDENRFYPGMGTEFLRLIGEVLGRHLPKVPAAGERLRA